MPTWFEYEREANEIDEYLESQDQKSKKIQEMRNDKNETKDKMP